MLLRLVLLSCHRMMKSGTFPRHQGLNIKKSTPNCIVYGETGFMPLKLDIQSRIVAFWSKLIQPETINLSTKLYRLAKSYNENRQTQSCFKWFDNIRYIFINCGCNGIWENQNFPGKDYQAKTIRLIHK